MRKRTFAFLILTVTGIFSPTQAGLLTNGNIFAEGLAGCSIGAVVGLISGIVVPSIAPTAGVANLGAVGGCMTGAAALVVLNSAVYFSNFSQKFFNLYQPLEDTGIMVYPPTPGMNF